ncbi:hypothetical protein AGABI1DRAFT_111652 [Agaricus bisporus var. burnettii JB137-S8]|uniref:DUF1014-domain-containing protein n=1 Tax=Agaricus bisporus var. burnettii (strain JB137-S8 / ATCC MYA-4627 / FGSC 10392) TaxID=597362 RepID=K5XI64_AGABU|nr:uncharacterized protein AGABI1DRAFT_111652 [Agaricus bisporus var. burnettii JB137-S8]EKM83163.1 hypothetical protein AGABI1DRAFT_111652 [Agaricus bisporus var. burnettii JB137-S8]
MAPGKGTNTKKESGRAKKAENEAKKRDAAAAEKERKEADAWTDKDAKAGKAAKEAKEEKRKADLARKAENARLLAEEESSLKDKAKAVPKASQKKKSEPTKPAGPGAIAAGGGISPESTTNKGKGKDQEEGAESFSATGIDNALDLLEVVTAKMDKASLGSQAAGMEKHPERRFKAAFEAYQERELPILKEDHPGLRLQQYKDLLFKQFQKAPENPYNQTTVSYDASKEERLDALKRRRLEVEERLRE